MRYALGFVLVLALVASPLRVKAQTTGGDSLSSWQTHEKASRSISEEQRGVRNAAIGLGVSSAVLSIGIVVTFAGLSFGDCGEWFGDVSPEKRQQCDRTAYSGVAISAVGAIGLITSGVLFGKRKRDRDRSRQARVQTAPRVQWDLARSRLVF